MDANETNLNPLLLFFLFGLNFISNEYLLPILVEDDKLSGKKNVLSLLP